MKKINTNSDDPRFVVDVLERSFKEKLKTFDVLNVALSGGNSPLKFYSELSARDVDFSRINFFLVDERNVVLQSSDSNFFNISKSFGDKVKIVSMRIDNNSTNLTVVQDYNKRLLEAFSESGRNYFDIVLLGIGLDGHTASLFPNSTGLKNTKKGYIFNQVENVIGERFTLTYAEILASSEVVILAKGEKKEELLNEALDSLNDDKYPISRVLREHKNIIWIK